MPVPYLRPQTQPRRFGVAGSGVPSKLTQPQKDREQYDRFSRALGWLNDSKTGSALPPPPLGVKPDWSPDHDFAIKRIWGEPEADQQPSPAPAQPQPTFASQPSPMDLRRRAIFGNAGGQPAGQGLYNVQDKIPDGPAGYVMPNMNGSPGELRARLGQVSGEYDATDTADKARRLQLGAYRMMLQDRVGGTSSGASQPAQPYDPFAGTPAARQTPYGFTGQTATNQPMGAGYRPPVDPNAPVPRPGGISRALTNMGNAFTGGTLPGTPDDIYSGVPAMVDSSTRSAGSNIRSAIAAGGNAWDQGVRSTVGNRPEMMSDRLGGGKIQAGLHGIADALDPAAPPPVTHQPTVGRLGPGLPGGRSGYFGDSTINDNELRLWNRGGGMAVGMNRMVDNLPQDNPALVAEVNAPYDNLVSQLRQDMDPRPQQGMASVSDTGATRGAAYDPFAGTPAAADRGPRAEYDDQLQARNLRAIGPTSDAQALQQQQASREDIDNIRRQAAAAPGVGTFGAGANVTRSPVDIAMRERLRRTWTGSPQQQAQSLGMDYYGGDAASQTGPAQRAPVGDWRATADGRRDRIAQIRSGRIQFPQQGIDPNDSQQMANFITNRDAGKAMRAKMFQRVQDGQDRRNMVRLKQQIPALSSNDERARLLGMNYTPEQILGTQRMRQQGQQQGIDNAFREKQLAESIRQANNTNILKWGATQAGEGQPVDPAVAQQMADRLGLPPIGGAGTGTGGSGTRVGPIPNPTNLVDHASEGFTSALDSLSGANIGAMSPDQLRQHVSRLGLTPESLRQYIDVEGQPGNWTSFDSFNPLNTSKRASRLRRLELARRISDAMNGAARPAF